MTLLFVSAAAAVLVPIVYKLLLARQATRRSNWVPYDEGDIWDA